MHAVELQACAAAASEKIVMLEEAAEAATLAHDQETAAALSQTQAAQVRSHGPSRAQSESQLPVNQLFCFLTCSQFPPPPTIHHLWAAVLSLVFHF